MTLCAGASAEGPWKGRETFGRVSGWLCAISQFLGGSVAGTTAKTIVYPLDRLKIRLQVRSASVGNSFSIQLLPHELRQLVRSEGVLSLWKGNFSAVCRTFPHSGIVYFSFDRYLAALEELGHGCSKINRLLAGAASAATRLDLTFKSFAGHTGMTSTCITYPLDVLNTRMCVTRRRLSYRQVALLGYEGISSLYRGFVPTLLGVIPYASISFFIFETLKQHYRDNKKEFTTFHALAYGGFAGALSQTATYPLDSVRKLMQTNSFLYKYQEVGHLGNMHLTVADSFRYIYRRGGIKGFYSGASLCWIKGFSAAGISFTLNETFRGMFK